METYKISGREFPVVCTVTIQGQPVPVPNIHMMSEERERELARKGAAV